MNTKSESTKLCRSCLNEKASNAFYPSVNTDDGLRAWCKQCVKDSKERRKAVRSRAAQGIPEQMPDDSVRRPVGQHSTETKYKTIPGFPGYQAGDDGSIWTCRLPKRVAGYLTEWRERKGTKGDKGRVLMRVIDASGRSCNRLVHHLILLAFVGPRPDGMEACHLNDIPSDNRLSNLRWDTHPGNMEDAMRNGRMKGTRHKAKLTDDQVREARSMRGNGWQIKDIANHFGIHPAQMGRVLSGESYTHVATPAEKKATP